jgi:glycerol kinase
VSRPAMIETTALGAGILAGMATGLWKSPRDVAVTREGRKIFRPRMKQRERDALIDGWRDAVARVLMHPQA